jgi:uncharacterized membrane protein YfcA
MLFNSEIVSRITAWHMLFFVLYAAAFGMLSWLFYVQSHDHNVAKVVTGLGVILGLYTSIRLMRLLKRKLGM